MGAIVFLFLFIQAGSTSSLWVTFVMLGFCLHAMVPVTVVLAQEYVPNNAGMAAGMMMGLAFGLGGVGVTLNTYVAEFYGVVPGLLSTMPLMALGSLLSIFLKEQG